MPAHAQIAVDHRLVVAAHAARADRMVVGDRGVGEEGVDRVVGLDGRAGQELLSAPRVERRGLADPRAPAEALRETSGGRARSRDRRDR